MDTPVRLLAADPATLPDALRSAWARREAVLLVPTDPREAHRVVGDVLGQARTATPEGDDPGADTHRLPTGTMVVEGLPTDAALIVGTSGATGPVKGVVLSHAALHAATTASVRRLGAVQGEVFALALPLHHVAGLQILLRSWMCGTDAIQLDLSGPHPVFRTLGGTPIDTPPRRDRRHVSLVPTQLRRLLEQDPDWLTGWRSVLVGGAALDEELDGRLQAVSVPLVRSYGMTETAGGCVYDGRPLDDVTVTLVTADAATADAEATRHLAETTDRRSETAGAGHVGRIRIDGPPLFAGYVTAGVFRAQPAGGWTSADVGRFAADGTLTVLGRADEVIVSGGENLPAPLIAARLEQHPDVVEVSVVGVADPEWGHVVAAAIVPRDGMMIDLDAVRDWVSRALPRKFAPRRLVIVDKLPRVGLGKPDYAAIVALFDSTRGPKA